MAAGAGEKIFLPFEADTFTPEPGRYTPTIHEVRDIALMSAMAIKESGLVINKIVGVSRGGLPVMDCFARTLEVRNTDVYAVEIYKKNPRANEPGQPPEILLDVPFVYKEPIFDEANADGQNVLVVEDLTDSGTTLRLGKTKWPKAIYTALYIKEEEETALGYVDFYGLCVGGRHIWIDNPWEVEQRLGYSPIRVVDSIKWALEGRPNLEAQMLERRKLLQRPELLERIAA